MRSAAMDLHDLPLAELERWLRRRLETEPLEPGSVDATSLGGGILRATRVIEMAPCGTMVFPTGTFETKQHRSTVVLWCAGSMYATVSSQIGAVLVVDGVSYGPLTLYPNDTLHHHALIPLTEVIRDVPAGTHTVSFTGFGSYGIDGNDWFDVTALELPNR